MNEFSLVCRILGSLFYRSPVDPVIEPLLKAITLDSFSQNWPLEQDALFIQLKKHEALDALQIDYLSMFGQNGSVSPYRSDYVAGEENECRRYLQQVGMTLSDAPADHFGLLLLAASWIEDHAQEDEFQAQLALFDDYLLTWSDIFLGKVEAHAKTSFYRILAQITRGALQALSDELNELDNNQSN